MPVKNIFIYNLKYIVMTIAGLFLLAGCQSIKTDHKNDTFYLDKALLVEFPKLLKTCESIYFGSRFDDKELISSSYSVYESKNKNIIYEKIDGRQKGNLIKEFKGTPSGFVLVLPPKSSNSKSCVFAAEGKFKTKSKYLTDTFRKTMLRNGYSYDYLIKTNERTYLIYKKQKKRFIFDINTRNFRGGSRLVSMVVRQVNVPSRAQYKRHKKFLKFLERVNSSEELAKFQQQQSTSHAHAENTRIANQQAVAQQQRIQQQQQVFINQSRARNPAPPTGLRQ